MSNKIQTRKQIITPEWAKSVLERMNAKVETGELRQRRLSKRLVNQYASDMANGQWHLTHQSLGFYSNGDLFDGQHRLWAVVKAGVKVEMMVTNGVEKRSEVMDSIDSGKRRSIPEALHISHGFRYEESRIMATCTRFIGEFCSKFSFAYSISQCLQMMDIYQKDIAAIVSTCRAPQRASKPIMSAIAFFHASNPKDAIGFADSFYNLEGLEEGDPPLMLNRYYVNHLGRRGGGDAARNSIAATAHAIYAYKSGAKIGKAVPSNTAMDWMMELQSDNVKRVINIISRTDAEMDRQRQR